MFFLPPPPKFTHRARLYGFPCWYRSDGPDGCDLRGTNVVAKWCVEHVAPWLHWTCEHVRYLACPWAYEPGGWPIEIRGQIKR